MKQTKISTNKNKHKSKRILLSKEANLPSTYKSDSTIIKPNISEIEFQIRKLFYSHIDAFEYHQWPREGLRWAELIFSLLLRINYNHQNIIRDIVEKLYDLELLDVERLAGIQGKKGDIDFNSPYARRIAEILSEYGFTYENSQSSILTMHEAAKSLKQYHDGKIQRYLRRYGQLMIDELNQNFSFSKMNKDDVKYAFIFWLQNVLNMPISLQNESTKEFCSKIRLTPEELIEEVDKLDVNLAVVDDVINNWNFLEKEKQINYEANK